jgi:hypothetical protein
LCEQVFVVVVKCYVMDGIALLRQAADTLAELDPDALSDEELGETLIEWRRQEARLTASKARVTAAFDVRGSYRADGSKTAAAWLARHTNGSLGELRAATRLARRLRHMPATQEALESGEISERHAEVLAGLYGSPRKPVADRFAAAEQRLVEYAKTLGFDEFVAMVKYWEAVVDEDGVEEKAQWDHESRHLNLSQTYGGNYRLDGQLDPIGGTEVAEELRRIYQELWKADWAAAKAIHGDDTTDEHLARNPRQRRADALAEMARRSAATPADAQTPRPLLVVHLGDESLRRMCELASGKVIAPGLLVPLLGEAEIQRIVYAGKPRRITELGTRTRFFSGPLREAILLRDRRCVEPGCDVPADQCDVDHLVPHSKGGPTTQSNGGARCGSHNRHKSDTLLDDYDPDDRDSDRCDHDPDPPPDNTG